MNLIIHDLPENKWKEIENEYAGWNVVSRKSHINSCIGCFGCWVRTPGQCVIKDDFNQMGVLLSQAEELVIISRYTFGGFSSFVKNVLDRGISYVLPYFEVVGGEMHHKARYKNKRLQITVYFYGEQLTDEEKANVYNYVKAISVNLKATLKEVSYKDIDCPDIHKHDKGNDLISTKKVILLNCSYRGERANSAIFLNKLKEQLNEPVEVHHLLRYQTRENELLELIVSADKVVFGMPLYVDGVPSAVVSLMEKLYKTDKGSKKKIYVLANMGFFESRQLCNLLQIMKTWCKKMEYQYCGGLAIGAGGMVGPMLCQMPLDCGPVKKVGLGIQSLSKAIMEESYIDDIYAEPYKFPRFLYILAAHSLWSKNAKSNGLKKKDLFTLPKEP